MLAVYFYWTLSEDTGNSFDETIEAFRNFKKKPLVSQGKLVRSVQQRGETITDFLRDLQTLDWKV